MSFEFELGEVVYLKTDSEQLERIVTERKDIIGGSKQYGLSTDLIFSFHYAAEITREYNTLKALKIREAQENN